MGTLHYKGYTGSVENIAKRTTACGERHLA